MERAVWVSEEMGFGVDAALPRLARFRLSVCLDSPRPPKVESWDLTLCCCGPDQS